MCKTNPDMREAMAGNTEQEVSAAADAELAELTELGAGVPRHTRRNSLKANMGDLPDLSMEEMTPVKQFVS